MGSVSDIVSWQIRYYRNGRRYEESSHRTRKGDAERLLKIREGDVAKGLPVSAKIGQLRFDEAQGRMRCEHSGVGRPNGHLVARVFSLTCSTPG